MVLADHSTQQNGGQRRPKTATRAREEVVNATYYAPRGQKTPPLGMRPAPLPEVARPQGSTEARFLVDGGSSLTLPVLAGRAAEEVDSSPLRLLTASALEARRKEEKKEKMLEQSGLELRSLLSVPWGPTHGRAAEQDQCTLSVSAQGSSLSKRKREVPKSSSSLWCTDTATWAVVALSLFVLSNSYVYPQCKLCRTMSWFHSCSLG